MEINERDLLAAYKEVGEEGKRALEKVFGEDLFNPKDITEQIKTFEDACNELGDLHQFVRSYNGYITYVHEDFKKDNDIIAFLKLRIICAALNEGWEPQFTEDEHRYYPYLILYTKEEVEKMDEETRKMLGLFGGAADAGSWCGPVAAPADSAFGHAHAYIGSRLALKTREIAEYCGRQFIGLWKDLYVGK